MDRLDLLRRMATTHEGAMVGPGDLDRLADQILARTDIRSVSHFTKRYSDLTGTLWLFLAILALDTIPARFLQYSFDHSSKRGVIIDNHNFEPSTCHSMAAESVRSSGECARAGQKEMEVVTCLG